jgi:hypothetical protein
MATSFLGLCDYGLLSLCALEMIADDCRKSWSQINVTTDRTEKYAWKHGVRLLYGGWAGLSNCELRAPGENISRFDTTGENTYTVHSLFFEELISLPIDDSRIAVRPMFTALPLLSVMILLIAQPFHNHSLQNNRSQNSGGTK